MIPIEKIKYINIALAVLTVLVSIALLLHITTFSLRYNNQVDTGHDLDMPQIVQLANKVTLKSLPAYKQLFLTKKLFRPFKKQGPKTRVLTIDDVTRDLMLIGVVKQDQPEAIVKNRRTRQTYFVRKGASLGKISIEAVKDDRIIVRYGEETKPIFIK